MTGQAAPVGSLAGIVANGLCSGCGLCAAIAGPAHVAMTLTPEGRERPLELRPLDGATFDAIGAACPGLRVEAPAPADPGGAPDAIWGAYRRIDLGWSADPEIRFRGSSGGVLTSLALHLLESGRVVFVLHVGADPERPMRSRWRLSFDRADLLRGAGSRYGPAAPLAGLEEALGRDEPFAFIGKPCDVGALRLRARRDPRIDRLCRATLSVFCGGVPALGRSAEVLDRFGVREEDVSLFRYRGHGNPGRTRVETRDGGVFEATYGEVWADEAGARYQFRCKICPDAIGEAADVVAFDVWPGASPEGDHPGRNGLLTRTARGEALVTAAVRAGRLVLERTLDPREIDYFQAHQARRKRAVWARLAGVRHAGHPVPEAFGLRIEDLARGNELAANLREARGARHRIRAGGAGEPRVHALSDLR